jgi:hypothetical protein
MGIDGLRFAICGWAVGIWISTVRLAAWRGGLDVLAMQVKA